MSKFAHVVKKAGHLINDGYLEKVIKSHRHSFGIAVANEDKILVVRQTSAASVDMIKQMQEEFKDSSALICFGDVAHILEEDIQPISILKGPDGSDLCVVCLDGDFDRHRKSNESHTAEYLVAKGSVEKRIKRMLQDSKGFDDVITKLKDDITLEDFQNMWGTHGSITFLFADGHAHTITGGNEKKGEYSWGFASDNCGYLEQVGAAEAPSTKQNTSALDKLKNLVMTGSKTTQPAPQNGTVVSNGMTVEKAQTAVQEPLPEGTVLVKPDFSHASLDTRKKQKSFYEDRLGYEPQQYKNAPPLLRIPSQDGQFTWKMADTKSLEILKHTLVMFPAKQPLAAEAPPAETKPAEQPKPEPKVEPKAPTAPVPAEPKADDLPPWLKGAKTKVTEVKNEGVKQNLPAGSKDKIPAAPVTQRMPTISPDQKQKVQEIMKKTELVGQFSEGMKKIIDPKDIRKQIENQIPDFAKNFGLGEDMAVFDSWSYEQFFTFCSALLEINKKPDVFAKMMFDLRNYALHQKLSYLTNPNNKPNRVVA